MTNSADPDQKPTDVDLHCFFFLFCFFVFFFFLFFFLRQGMSCSAREGLIQRLKLSCFILTHITELNYQFLIKLSCYTNMTIHNHIESTMIFLIIFSAI